MKGPSRVKREEEEEEGKKDREHEQEQEEQVTRGHNIIANGLAGAANPHPHPRPHPTPFPIRTHTRKASKMLFFPLFDSCSRMDGPTDQRTDGRTKPLIELRVRN